jgi:hypothetical protein
VEPAGLQKRERWSQLRESFGFCRRRKKHTNPGGSAPLRSVGIKVGPFTGMRHQTERRIWRWRLWKARRSISGNEKCKEGRKCEDRLKPDP